MIDGMSDRGPEPDPKDPFELMPDPGWKPWGRLDDPDGLVALRFVFVQFIVALIGVGVILSFIVTDSDPIIDGLSTPASVGLVVVVGVVSVALVWRMPIGLDCSDELALARSWRTRFFARMAAAELSALVGFAAVLMTAAPALYALGLAFTAVGFALAGPTRANIIRDQETLAREACAIALKPALRHHVTSHTR